MISFSQLVLGVYLTSFMATHPGRKLASNHMQPHPLLHSIQLRPFQRGSRTTPSEHVSLNGIGPPRWHTPSFHSAMVRKLNFRISPSRLTCEMPFPKDFLAFVVVAYIASKSTVHKYGFPSLVRTLARDATKYFLVIFTAHLVLAMTLLFASVGLGLQFAVAMELTPFSSITVLAIHPADPRNVSRGNFTFLP